MEDQYSFYAYINRMKYINRWGLMRNTETENIQEHSYQVAVLAHALGVINNVYFGGDVSPEKATIYALFHDANEIITGDLPTPVKYYNPAISESYKKLEDVTKEKLISMLPEETKDIYRDIFFFEHKEEDYRVIVKAADRLSAYIKCIEELKAGNREFEKASLSVKKSLEDMHLKELDWFMEHCLEPYMLTLDELN